MKKEVSPVIVVIAIIVVIVVAVFLYWNSQPHQKAVKGMPAMTPGQQKGFQALKGLAPAANGAPNKSGAASNPGMRAMQRLAPGGGTGGR